MSKENLDEMQLQRRNKYGYQAFIILCFLIMIDSFLYGMGLRWLSYPANVFTIMLVCMGYYLIRTIWGNAVIGPKGRDMAAWKKWTIFIVSSVLGVILVVFISQTKIIKIPMNAGNGYEAIILFIISAASLLLVLTVSLVKKNQNNKDDE